jgi:hypothetical protein
MMTFFISPLCVADDETSQVTERVEAIYELIGVEAGSEHRIDELALLWHPNARLVLHKLDGSLQIQAAGEFFRQLRERVETGQLGVVGFREEVVTVNVHVYGRIAQARVHYRLYSPAGSETFAREGLDMIQLIKTGVGWQVISLINQVTDEKTGVPAS